MNVRNLEQIQEEDPKRQQSRLGTLLLASLGGAMLVFVGITVTKRGGEPARSASDPLAALVASAKVAGKAPEALDGRDVSFPRILSDGPNSTTALAAVKDARGKLVDQEQLMVLQPAAPDAPPIASDRLPVAPLPVGAMLAATPVVTDPKDELTALAASGTTGDEGANPAPPGNDGGYQLQVASFKDKKDAERLVEDLRKRGHRAFSQSAYVPDRGLWHRVRIGPFKTHYEANQYKKTFERGERMVPFVIDPDKIKQAEEMRKARLEARERKTAAARKSTAPER